MEELQKAIKYDYLAERGACVAGLVGAEGGAISALPSSLSS
jgi:hypothetical protein